MSDNVTLLPERPAQPARSPRAKIFIWSVMIILVAISIYQMTISPVDGTSLLVITVYAMYYYWTSWPTDQSDRRMRTAFMVSFLTGVKLLMVLATTGKRNDRDLRSPDTATMSYPAVQISATARLINVVETLGLSVLSIFSLGEYAWLQADADDRDREELFSRLNTFFEQYGTFRNSSERSFTPFTGRNFKPSHPSA